jgi:hypothetical protein
MCLLHPKEFDLPLSESPYPLVHFLKFLLVKGKWIIGALPPTQDVLFLENVLTGPLGAFVTPTQANPSNVSEVGTARTCRIKRTPKGPIFPLGFGLSNSDFLYNSHN